MFDNIGLRQLPGPLPTPPMAKKTDFGARKTKNIREMDELQYKGNGQLMCVQLLCMYSS